MSPDKNNWQDLASDLGLSFEIDPNAPELPPEPEPVVVVEQTVLASVTIETPAITDAELIETAESVDEAGHGVNNGLQDGALPGETAEEARKRKRGRRRRRGRGEGGPGDGDSGERTGSETPELVGSPVGRSHSEAGSDDDDSPHMGGHGHSSHDEEEFVLEDLTNLNVPIWTELIDSLYRPDR